MSNCWAYLFRYAIAYRNAIFFPQTAWYWKVNLIAISCCRKSRKSQFLSAFEPVSDREAKLLATATPPCWKIALRYNLGAGQIFGTTVSASLREEWPTTREGEEPDWFFREMRHSTRSLGRLTQRRPAAYSEKIDNTNNVHGNHLR